MEFKLTKSEHHEDVWLLNTADGKAIGEVRGKQYAAELMAVLISPKFLAVAVAERDHARYILNKKSEKK